MFTVHATWRFFLEARERNREWAGSQGRSSVLCVLMVSPAGASGRTHYTLPNAGNPGLTYSLLHTMNFPGFVFYCASAVFSFWTLQSSARPSHILSAPDPSHWHCCYDQGREQRASLCSGNECLILFCQDTQTRKKNYKWISRWYLSICFSEWERRRKLFAILCWFYSLFGITSCWNYDPSSSLQTIVTYYTIPTLYPRVLQLHIQPTSARKYLKKEISASSRKQSLNLWGADNYLHSICIIFTTICTAFTLY